MSEALEKVISDDQRVALAMAISQSGGALPARLPAVADQLGVSVADLASLLNEPGFLKLIRGLTRAQAALTFNGNISKLADIVETGDNKEVLSAMQMLGRITGDLKAQHQVDVKVSFEDLRNRGADAADPLNSLFDIKGDIIEAEPIDADAVAEEAEYAGWEADNAG